MPAERLNAARKRLAELREQAETDAAAAADIADRLQAQTYTASSPGREVRVTIGADALIQDVSFSARATSLTASGLANVVLQAHRGALAALREGVEKAADDAPASIRGLTDAIVASAREMLPTADGFEPHAPK